MAYFPNSDPGIAFELAECEGCIHEAGPDGDSGCHVWLVHMLYNYEQHKDGNEALRGALSTLIDDSKPLGSMCQLRHPVSPEEDEGQERLFASEPSRERGR